MCPLDVNVYLNSETKLCSQLLVDCCTFGITRFYKIYQYDILRMIRRCMVNKNNDG
jgi:hypothetical protein